LDDVYGRGEAAGVGGEAVEDSLGSERKKGKSKGKNWRKQVLGFAQNDN
jgi:hypothetical protein